MRTLGFGEAERPSRQCRQALDRQVRSEAQPIPPSPPLSV